MPNSDQVTDRLPALLERVQLVQRFGLLLLLGGMVLLLLEIRFEHQAVLGDKWQAWIPLGYLSVMSVATPVGLVVRNRFGRYLLAAGFAGLMVVGCLGFWFHSGGKLSLRLGTIVRTVLSSPGQLLESDDSDTSAPLLAPLSLVGLGAIGILIAGLPSASKTVRLDAGCLRPLDLCGFRRVATGGLARSTLGRCQLDSSFT